MISQHIHVSFLLLAILIVKCHAAGQSAAKKTKREEDCDWIQYEDKVLQYHNKLALHTPNKNADECKEKCTQSNELYNFECKSFEYVPMAPKDCVLSVDTYESAKLLYDLDSRWEEITGASYYEYECNSETGDSFGRSQTASCPEPWTKIGDHCFYIVNATVSFDNAITKCADMDATLASVHSKAEDDFIHTEMAATTINELWLGMNNPQDQDVNWIDGTEMDYITDRTVEYQDGIAKEKCVVVRHDYSGKTGWYDRKCTKRLCYVCRKEAKKPQKK